MLSTTVSHPAVAVLVAELGIHSRVHLYETETILKVETRLFENAFEDLLASDREQSVVEKHDCYYVF